MPEPIIDLSAQAPVAEGRDQSIFRHPHWPGCLIKVAKPNPKRRYLTRYGVWRYRHLRGWHRELGEYVAMLARNGAHCDRLARHFGFCDTNLGPGMIVECIVDGRGEIAPTLSRFLADQVRSPEVMDLLRQDVGALFAALRANRIIFHDFHSRNVVVAGDTVPRLIIIDGIGSSALVPMAQFSRRAYDAIAKAGEARLLDEINGYAARNSAAQR